MNLRAGFPFDLIKNGLPFDYPKLQKDLKTDVLIMGGGISGALVAHALIKNGVSCVVTDARSIGLGSTCASTSLLQYEIDIPLHKLIKMIGYKNALRAYKLCGQSIQELEAIAKETGFADFNMKGSLYYAAYKKDINSLREEFMTRKESGFDVRWLDEKNIQHQFGFNAPGAILSALGASTNAYMFTHYLHQYNISKGLQVYDRTEISSIHHAKTGVRLKTKEGFMISAKKLVYATGYEVVNYISKPIVKLHSTYATISEPIRKAPPYWKNDVLIWNTADPYLYMRSTPDHRIAIGGRDEMFISPGLRDKLIPKKSVQLSNDFKKMFPHIPFTAEFSWTGVFGSTKDGLPFIGEYKPLPHSLFALGFGGNGITFSQVAARIIASMVHGKKNKDAGIFSFERL